MHKATCRPQIDAVMVVIADQSESLHKQAGTAKYDTRYLHCYAQQEHCGTLLSLDLTIFI